MAVWRHTHVSRCCAPRAIQLLKSAPGPPGRLQPMHTKCEMVCTCLPEAMLINSITLIMTRMAPKMTALGVCGPMSVLSNLCERPADLNGGHPAFFYLNLAKIRPTLCINSRRAGLVAQPTSLPRLLPVPKLAPAILRPAT